MNIAHRDDVSCFSRRAALSAGLTVTIAGLLPHWVARAQGVVPDALEQRFLAWSRMATGFTDLPVSTARTCLEWVLRSGVTAEDVSSLDPAVYRGTSLEKRLLEAWYTGLFKVGGSSEKRNYDTTLMWQAAGIDPPPTSCGGTPDRWASTPSNI